MSAAIILLFIVAIAYSLYIARFFGRGFIRIPFVYFAVSLFIMLLSFVFIILVENGFYAMEDVNFHIWWHLMFFLGMIAFILSSKKLKEVIDTMLVSESMSDLRNEKIFLAFSVIVSLAVFLAAQPLEPYMSEVFVGSFVDYLGLHHFLVFISAFMAAGYLFTVVRGQAQMFRRGAFMFLIFLVLISLQHLLELLSESWKVVALPGGTVEIVEKFIVATALVLLILGLHGVLNFVEGYVKGWKLKA